MQHDGGDSEVTGVLLAGGRSARMGGQEKALLELSGEPMLAHVIARMGPQVGALIINANGDAARFSPFGLPVVPDTLEDFAGPLAGLHAGMVWSQRETPSARFVASLAGDTPFTPRELVARLKSTLLASGATCAIAASGSRQHPIVGLWDISLAGNVADALEKGVRAMHRFAEDNASAVVDFPNFEIGGTAIDPFFNVNTPADLETARMLSSKPAGEEPARG
jgi:molybdopterin-guanine dinucleotide biosynthesis protein A